MLKDYDETIAFEGHRIRIRMTATEKAVFYDEVKVAEPSHDPKQGMGTVWFTAIENNAQTKYDVAIIVSGGEFRCFLGRDGKLIFTDSQGLGTNLVDDVVDHLSKPDSSK